MNIINLHNKINNIKESSVYKHDQIAILHNEFNKFNTELEIFTTAIDTVEKESIPIENLKIDEVLKKFIKIKEVIQNILKVHTSKSFNFNIDNINNIDNTNPFFESETDIVKHTSLNKYSMYYGFIDNHKKLLLKIQNDIKNGINPKNNILNSLQSSIVNSINKIDNFIVELKKKILKSNSEIQHFEDKFDENDIVFTSKNVYIFTKKINIVKNTQIINPQNMKLINEIIKEALKFPKYDKYIVDTINTTDTNNTIEEYLNTVINEIKMDVVLQTEKEKEKNQVDGGKAFNDINIISESDIQTNIQILIEKINIANTICEKYIESIIAVKLSKIQRNNYFLYLMLISNSTETEIYIKYVYINKGIIQFYLRLIKSIQEQIKIGNVRSDILYFKQNHYIVLHKLCKFLTFMLTHMDTRSIINIKKCKGNIKKNFFILNHFKDILESYNEILQSKVSVYGRINDWGTLTGPKIFLSDTDDARMLKIIRENCISGQKQSNIKFTEIFDTENFNSNESIARYMTLPTQLSKKKGVMLATYGYSGTGKTFTLFGKSESSDSFQQPRDVTGASTSVAFSNSEVRVPGILQSVLNNVNGVTQIKFRVFELYGKGVQYPHYWSSDTSEGNIDRCMIGYDLFLEDNEIKIKGSGCVINIINSLHDQIKYFVTIKDSEIQKVFMTFDKFIESLDNIRRNVGRIRITSNNPESSRSIIIYEFQLLIENSYVPFIIVDLPGREEIVETYCDNFLLKAPKQVNTLFNQALLTSMSINPLALSILTPSIIFETFNNLSIDDRKNIADTKLLVDGQKILSIQQHTEHIGEYDDDESIESIMTDSTNKSGEIFKDEYFTTLRTGTKKTLSYIYNFADNDWTKLRKFKMVNYDNGRHGVMINIVMRGSKLISPKNIKQISADVNSIQYEGSLAIHLMNRLILLNRFDVIDKIYQNIAATYLVVIPESKIKNMLRIDKIQKLEPYFDIQMLNSITDDKLTNLLDNTFNFKSTTAPFEGIFINENIVGLIKVLARNILERSDTFIKEHLMQEQDSSLDFTNQKKLIRESNINLYTERVNSDENVLQFYNVFIRNSELENIINNNRRLYSSQKIYNYKNPSIHPIIDVYLKKRNNIEPVVDFKLFYLLTNTSPEKKCIHQLKLLDNTKSFISATDINFE